MTGSDPHESGTGGGDPPAPPAPGGSSASLHPSNAAAGPERVAPGRRFEVSVLAWLLARAGGRLAGTEPVRLFLVLGRHRRLFRGWLSFAARLMPFGALPRHESELVILRIAHLRGCDYERIHHERIGQRAGLTDDDIARTARPVDEHGWTPRRFAVLAAVDMLHHTGDLDDATWNRLRDHLSERECIELCLLAGHYDMLATVITTLRIRPEQPRTAAPDR